MVIRSIPKTRNVIMGTRSEIVMVYIQGESPFQIELKKITDFSSVVCLELSSFNPYNTWLCSSLAGKVNIWNRKVIQRQLSPAE